MHCGDSLTLQVTRIFTGVRAANPRRGTGVLSKVFRPKLSTDSLANIGPLLWPFLGFYIAHLLQLGFNLTYSQPAFRYRFKGSDRSPTKVPQAEYHERQRLRFLRGKNTRQTGTSIHGNQVVYLLPPEGPPTIGA